MTRTIVAIVVMPIGHTAFDIFVVTTLAIAAANSNKSNEKFTKGR